MYIFSDGRTDDIFLVDRSLQALETIDWINTTSSDTSFTSPLCLGTSGNTYEASLKPDLIIFAGDLNTEPGFLPYRVLTELGDFLDANGNVYSCTISFNMI